ncbi:MAG: response regulator [Spirochaetes bacterium]|nr:response regulator [Spirochaetota bacterium]
MKTVFIVDDNDSQLFAAKKALEGVYKTFALPSAEKMFQLAEKITPDIILLDIEMPETDGFQTIQRLKADKKLSSIPVIFLTIKSDEAAEIQGFKMGAIDYINKPFSAPVLIRRLETHIDIDKLVKEEARRAAGAEENSQAKSRFLARMSHEIRTPISAVLGISEVQIRNPELAAPVKESFSKVHSAAQVLLGLVNDILDLSKIEAGKMEIANEVYETERLINDIVQMNLFRMGGKNIKFEIDIDSDIPVLLKGDSLRITQVMNNLLSNAFKYTEAGKVSLSAKYISSNGRQVLYFKIADTGCGMSEEELKTLFNEFERFNDGGRRNIEGAGLGMAIVESLLALMGAKLDVQSAPGAGTTVQLEIPQGRESDAVLGAELAESLQNFSVSKPASSKIVKFTAEPMPYGSVLVVDDFETNLLVAQWLLSFYSISVETCDSGQKALDLVKSGRVYDIIFMDHMMPGMDGIEAATRIRALGYKHPIVALTANVLIGQSDIFIENSFDGFISKPIDSSRLNAVLNKLVRDRHPPEVVEAARQDAARRTEVAAAVAAAVAGAAVAGEESSVSLARLLSDLEPLLKDGDPASAAASLEAAGRLRAVPQAAILVRQIEKKDFEGALKSLPVLQELVL